MQDDAPALGVWADRNEHIEVRLLVSPYEKRTISSGLRVFRLEARFPPVFSHILSDVVMSPFDVAHLPFSEGERSMALHAEFVREAEGGS